MHKSVLSQLPICIPPRPHSPFRNGHIYMKDAHCDETKKNTFSDFCDLFLFFEFWSIVLTSYEYVTIILSSVSPIKKIYKYSPKRCAMIWIRFFSSWVFFAIVSYRDMVEFVFDFCSRVVRFSTFFSDRLGTNGKSCVPMPIKELYNLFDLGWYLLQPQWL